MNNNFIKFILATMGACDAIIYMVTPILLSLTIINLGLLTNTYQITTLQSLATVSSIFRAIKIGFLKD